MGITLEQNISLAQYTTLRVGGEARYFVSVTTEEELKEAVLWAKSNSLPFYVIGYGSNILVQDSEVAGVAIKVALKGFSHVIEDDTAYLKVRAGEMLDEIVAYTVEQQWWGIENLSAIPGTVGAVPIQNVGAYGVEVKDVITCVRVFNTDTESFEVLQNNECLFSYRDSLFKSARGKKYIVSEVTFVLSKKENQQLVYKDLAVAFKDTVPSISAIRDAVIAIRREKFPDWSQIGTAGSFFKNPFVTKEKFTELKRTYPDMPGFETEDGSIKLSLGFILDKILNLRGYSNGFVSLYEKQALVLVVKEGATASLIKDFADDIVKRVKNEVGIDIFFEVTQLP